MIRHTLARMLVVGILVWGLLLPYAVAGAPAGDLAARLTRTDAGGGITIKAIYATREYFETAGNAADVAKFRSEANIVMLLTLDTHAGDLRAFDPAKGAVLRTDRGQQVAATRWGVITEGSHHREGALLFPKVDGQGRGLETDAKSVELVIRGLGDVPERVLRWDLPLR
ncbi:MAG: hypothetical protein HY660_01475 [Armatimonadetes bacterium]|nr:hypothetical protein [Armatimonadota bacterium]